MKYIDNLVDQFVKAYDLHNFDLNSKEFIEEFSRWIEYHIKHGENYKFLLNQMGIDITKKSVAEVGKTSFDSLCKNYETTIVTPYPYGFERNNNLVVSDLSINEDGKIQELDKIDTIMMTNPYNDSDLKNWDKYHNNGGNIIVGVYSEYSDKDIRSKIEQLERFKELLTEEYVERENCFLNTYCKVIVSKKITK